MRMHNVAIDAALKGPRYLICMAEAMADRLRTRSLSARRIEMWYLRSQTNNTEYKAPLHLIIPDGWPVMHTIINRAGLVLAIISALTSLAVAAPLPYEITICAPSVYSTKVNMLLLLLILVYLHPTRVARRFHSACWKTHQTRLT